MNDIDQRGKQKSRWSKYITALRICIGIVAIIVVIQSVQWRDAVKIDEKLLPIVEQTADTYRVENDAGQILTIDRTPDDVALPARGNHAGQKPQTYADGIRGYAFRCGADPLGVPMAGAA